MPDPNAAAAFNARYTAAYGDAPHVLAGIGYDAMRAVGETAATTGALGVTNLAGATGFNGAGGAFRLRSTGTVQRALAIAEIQDQQVAIIDPAPGRLGGPGF